jgi:hypothetical protein
MFSYSLYYFWQVFRTFFLMLNSSPVMEIGQSSDNTSLFEQLKQVSSQLQAIKNELGQLHQAVSNFPFQTAFLQKPGLTVPLTAEPQIPALLTFPVKPKEQPVLNLPASNRK